MSKLGGGGGKKFGQNPKEQQPFFVKPSLIVIRILIKIFNDDFDLDEKMIEIRTLLMEWFDIIVINYIN